MGAIDDFIRNAESINMNEVIKTAIRRNEQQVLNLNRNSQLRNRGIDGEGNTIKPSYRPRTIELKKQKGQTTKFVTLRDTGKFHSNFYIIYRNDEFEIVAHPTYREGRDLTIYLQGKYGVDIFGLTEQNIERIKKIILPDVRTQLQNHGI